MYGRDERGHKMKNIILIAAVQPETLAIGYKNELLFNVPEDMKFFKDATNGQQVVVGRKTWESIPNGLPNRDVFVLTTDPKRVKPAENVTVCKTMFEVLSTMDGSRPLFVIGGAEIYKMFLPHANQMLITIVDRPVENYDTTFPQHALGKWVRKQSTYLTKGADVVVHLLVRDET